MPARKRIRPVIEEIVETPAPAPVKEHHESAPEAKGHDHAHGHAAHHAHPHVRVEEEKAEPFVETMHEVASYDEPPQVDTPSAPAPRAYDNPEAAARELLGNEEEPERRSNFKVVFLVTIITALIVGFIAGGVYVYITGVNSGSTPEVTPTPSASPATQATATPVATPKPVVKLDTLSVNVLNGSGVIGAAGKVKSALEAAGFKVTGTGNAANYNFKNTVVQVKPGTSAEVIQAAKDALKDYVVEVGDELPASSKFDIVVTGGQQ